jgi:hypothetical protein
VGFGLNMITYRPYAGAASSAQYRQEKGHIKGAIQADQVRQVTSGDGLQGTSLII